VSLEELYVQETVLHGCSFRRSRFVARLAITALALLLAMPVLSRVVLPAAAATHCSMPDMPDMPGSMPDMPDVPGMAHADACEQPSDPLDVCGYCTLLLHSALLSGSVPAVAAALPARALLPLPACRDVLADVPVDGRPRGPPLS
jgi:hypothetical protein